jgi:hypothetical protein
VVAIILSIFSTRREFVSCGYFCSAGIAVLDADLDAAKEVGLNAFQYPFQLLCDLHSCLG